MATEKRLSLIYGIENFANTYLEKVTKFQGPFWSSQPFTGLDVENTPLSAYRVKVLMIGH